MVSLAIDIAKPAIELSKEEKNNLFFAPCMAITKNICQETLTALMINFSNPQKILADYKLEKNQDIDDRVATLFKFIMIDVTKLLSQSLFTIQKLLEVTTDDCNLLKYYGLPLVKNFVIELDTISPSIVDDAIATPMKQEWCDLIAIFDIR